MRKQTQTLTLLVSVVFIQAMLTACTPGSSSSESAVTSTGGVSIAYVKRPVSALGNPTDSVNSGEGGDLIIRDFSSPSGDERNVTRSYTLGRGDVSDPEVSYDGTKIIFSMRCTAQSAPQCYNYMGLGNDDSWNIWEYDIQARTLQRIIQDPAVSRLGDDVDPVYYPDGRIVFTSNRQATSSQPTASGVPGAVGYVMHDEYEREAVTVLHIMDANGSNIRQLTFNQSHDRNPVIMANGEIMYARWDHVGERNQFSIFRINPDGTTPELGVVYGAHSPGNSYLHPREMPDGRVMTSLMPLSGTREGGSLEIIDTANYSENDLPASSPGPVNQLGTREGQFQVSRLLLPNESVSRHEQMRGMRVSPLGRYSTPYPLWDNTNRVLVAYTPSQPTRQRNEFTLQNETVEGTPRYGIWMVDLNRNTLNVVVPPDDNHFYSDPIALQARTPPSTKNPSSLDTGRTGAGMGILNVKSVYDTDSLGRMGAAVLATGEAIPQSGGRADIATIKHPANGAYGSRVARFFRITRAVATPQGLDRETIGEAEFEMQQILGYGVVEPDGSFTARVPANTPIGITALDSEGRGFTHHTNWIQVREGEERTCNGCHGPRRSTVALNSPGTPGTSGTHPSAGAAGESMAETRFSQISAAVANLRMNPEFTDAQGDFWAARYNLRDGTTIPAETPISLTYDNLNAGAGHDAHSSVIPSPVRGGCTAANWSAVNCRIVINYEEQIQPIWNNHCASCHSGSSPAGALDLSSTVSAVFGRLNSYQELMVGDLVLDANGRPIITIDPEDGEFIFQRTAPPVNAGNGRSSRLIERLYETALRGDATVCPVNGVNGCVNHSAMLNASEKRLVTEWADIGAQYYNDPFDGSGNVRSSANLLSFATFQSTIMPILSPTPTTGCATCHRPFGGNGSSSGAPSQTFQSSNRFVLTGNAEADFGITASMVTNVCNPAASYLLTRPSGTMASNPPHPEVPSGSGTAALPAGGANYNAILAWIAAATPSATCP
jgi:hypothetical protein